jgi:hypothetical protein
VADVAVLGLRAHALYGMYGGVATTDADTAEHVLGTEAVYCALAAALLGSSISLYTAAAEHTLAIAEHGRSAAALAALGEPGIIRPVMAAAGGGGSSSSMAAGAPTRTRQRYILPAGLAPRGSGTGGISALKTR